MAGRTLYYCQVSPFSLKNYKVRQTNLLQVSLLDNLCVSMSWRTSAVMLMHEHLELQHDKLQTQIELESMLRQCVCTGVGHKPALDLSFLQHDFGACLVKQPGMQAIHKTLRLKNNDTSDLSFDIECVAQAFLPVVPLPCCISCPVASSPLLDACKKHTVHSACLVICTAAANWVRHVVLRSMYR